MQLLGFYRISSGFLWIFCDISLGCLKNLWDFCDISKGCPRYFYMSKGFPWNSCVVSMVFFAISI